jgi:pimeloyl-ACP methyl ester carboxylesterase
MLCGEALIDAGRTVIAYDNRGVPPSDVPPPPYTVEEMADDAIGLMEHLALGQYDVIGASLGGCIAQTVALRRPDLVRSVVFLASGGNFSAYARAHNQAQIDLLRSGIELPPSVLGWSMLGMLLTPSQQQDSTAVEFALGMAAMFGTLPAEGMLGQFEADVKWAGEDHLTELRDLKVPAIAIASEYDLFFPPALVKEAVHAMPSGSYVEIADAPHLAADKFDQVNSAVQQFLSMETAD